MLKKYPYYKTKVEKPKDLLVTAQVDEKLVNMGWRMSTKYVTEVYGRPIAEEGETVLEPRQQQIVPFGSPTAKSFLGQREDLLK